MFVMILALISSLVLEILMFVFTSPEKSDGSLNQFVVVFFSLNTAVLLGLIFSFLSIFLYRIFKAYGELASKSFFRRGILFGLLIFIILLGKFYEFLDAFIIGFLVIIFVLFEIIMSQRAES